MDAKFVRKLSSWKSRILSVGGRLSLIKAVLGSLPNYYISLYRMSVAIIKTLESLQNNFFICGDLEDKKMTWVAWRKFLVSRYHGGLGIDSIFALNMFLLFKWIWTFRIKPNDLWVKVIKAIYGDDGFIGKELVSNSTCSPWN